jgi:hypothetical protein
MFETNRTPKKTFYHQIWGDCPLISIHNNCWTMSVAGKPKPVKLYLKGSAVYPQPGRIMLVLFLHESLALPTYGQNKSARVSYFKVTPLECRYLSCTQQGAREYSDRVEWSRRLGVWGKRIVWFPQVNSKRSMQNVDKKNESEHSSTQRGSYEKPIFRSTCCESRDREIYLARDSNFTTKLWEKQQEFSTLSKSLPWTQRCGRKGRGTSLDVKSRQKESGGRLTVAKPESVHLRDARNWGRPLPLLLVSSHSLLRHRHILAHHTKPTKKPFTNLHNSMQQANSAAHENSQQ